ncbi:MAG: hypothetical protein ACREA0_06175, partial [bacterium]
VGRLISLSRTGTTGEVKHFGRLLGVPTPPVALRFRLVPNSRLDFESAKTPWPLRRFEGYFTCEAAEGGTRVVHEECFFFGPLSGRVFRLVFGRWLARDTNAEVLRMKSLIER